MNKNKGYSLLEVLVAMVIGLFLLAGIATSYIQSKKSYLLRNDMSALEDNGRFALELITRIVEHTGYSPNGRDINEQFFITESSDITPQTCPIELTSNVLKTSILRVISDDKKGDTLSTIFHADNIVFTDCAGNAIQPSCQLIPGSRNSNESKVYNSFYLDHQNNTLMCAGSRSAEAQVIAEGVENIQFLYGIKSLNNNKQISRYIKSSDLKGSDWSNVISVQIAILMRTLRKVKPQAEAKKFTLLNEVIETNDRYQHAVFNTTIQIRNL